MEDIKISVNKAKILLSINENNSFQIFKNGKEITPYELKYFKLEIQDNKFIVDIQEEYDPNSTTCF